MLAICNLVIIASTPLLATDQESNITAVETTETENQMVPYKGRSQFQSSEIERYRGEIARRGGSALDRLSAIRQNARTNRDRAITARDNISETVRNKTEEHYNFMDRCVDLGMGTLTALNELTERIETINREFPDGNSLERERNNELYNELATDIDKLYSSGKAMNEQLFSALSDLLNQIKMGEDLAIEDLINLKGELEEYLKYCQDKE